MQSVRKLYNSHYGNQRPFTDSEAWFIFRIAAFAEAIGWTLLITGIALKPISDTPVAIGGRIHGMLFVAYIVAVIAVGPSLKWNFIKIIVAGLMSTPPYGSLLFERVEALYRSWTSLRLFIARVMVQL